MRSFLTAGVVCLFAIEANAAVIIDFAGSPNGAQNAVHTLSDLGTDPVTLTITESDATNDFGALGSDDSFSVGTPGTIGITYFGVPDSASDPTARFRSNSNGIGVNNGGFAPGESIQITFSLSGLSGVDLQFVAYDSTDSTFQLTDVATSTVLASGASPSFAPVTISDGDSFLISRTGGGGPNSIRFSSFTIDTVVAGPIIPEPATASLLCGMLGLAGAARRRYR